MEGSGSDLDFRSPQPWLRGEYVVGFDYNRSPFPVDIPSIPLGIGNIISRNITDTIARAAVSGVRSVATGGRPPPISPTVVVTDPTSPVQVIDPSTAPQATVGEGKGGKGGSPGSVWGGIGFPSQEPTYSVPSMPHAPIYIPTPPVQTPATQQIPTTGGDMAVDWGNVLGGALGTVATGLMAPSPQIPPTFGSPTYNVATTPPATVTVDTRTGKVTTCKRRRRRRLLTESDFNDLMRISTLPTKDTVKIALAKAVGRR